jgi:hypothetical protein
VSSTGTSNVLDVAVVPDFLGPLSNVFEARTLLFLAAWMKYGDPHHRCVLHLAAIGEPPISVRRLAERAEARVSVHEPVDIGPSRTVNKLRGLDTKAETDRVLLLDVDTLTFGDVSTMAELDYCIAAAVAGKPRIKMRHWRRIYSALGLGLPKERITALYGELLDATRMHLRTSRQNMRLRAMVPFYNSGVLYLPSGCELRRVWEEHLRVIVDLFSPPDDDWPWLLSDETGLASAIQSLRTSGMPLHQLPDIAHARWQHVRAGRIRWGQPQIFHAMGIFRLAPDLAITSDSLRSQIRTYARAIQEGRNGSGGRFQDVMLRDAQNVNDFCRRLEQELLDLVDSYVAPALRDPVPLRR